ncbi:tetratricopeptide repeat protein [Saccharothrix coeruleofusca]|uniref:Tetratricopeptide repeat protein n=1 Tax=Saccharothrix coeruleofusca TaxID=33919 RepID=A0A918EBV1_9PSEU|nr:tetratricopeptide repeat protein [Saccharothrix coeruleofusca]GGP43664.1 hypothetical protein GCM10010185_14170 [Saccharothrix coeruleofusca]
MSEPITTAVVRAAELTASGLPHRAIALLRPALAADPLHPEAWCGLAAAHLDAGEPDPALEAAKRALVLGGDRSWAQRLTALALSELGRHTEAAVAARECARRAPGDWRCLVVLAEVLASDPGGRREAVAVAREATRLAPEQARTFQVLGDAALRVRDWGTAEHAYRTALRLDPSAEDVRANLATVRRKRGAPAPTASPAAEALAAAHALVWPAFSRLAAVLVIGGPLLLLAGMPRPTPATGALSGALVLLCAVIVLRPAARGRAVRRALLHLPRHRPEVAVVATAFGLALLVLVGWTAALLLGASTVQPLVVAWLCALAGGTVVVLGRTG